MTCIVGLVDRKKVYMAGDSAGSAGYSLNIRHDPKVFHVGDEMIMGICGSFRMRDLLAYHLAPPTYDENKHGEHREFIVVEVVEHIREVFKRGGFTEVFNNEESVAGSFMIGFKSSIYTIESDYQVAEQIAPFHAVGCGADIALGSLGTTDLLEPRMAPLDRLQIALETSERFNAGVRGPFNYVTNHDKNPTGKTRRTRVLGLQKRGPDDE